MAFRTAWTADSCGLFSKRQSFTCLDVRDTALAIHKFRSRGTLRCLSDRIIPKYIVQGVRVGIPSARVNNRSQASVCV